MAETDAGNLPSAGDAAAAYEQAVPNTP